MRHGGALLIECLMTLGAKKAFGVPGESFLAALDAMHDSAGRLDFVLCRQEGGAAFMAAAWGKLTGAPGVCFVTRGPGAANAAIGVHSAMQDSAPMILFVGQVATGMRGREAFQELDYRAVFGSMAKWAVEIDAVARLPEIVSRAWTVALRGPAGAGGGRLARGHALGCRGGACTVRTGSDRPPGPGPGRRGRGAGAPCGR